MNSVFQLIPLFVAVPLAGAFLIAILGRRFKALPDVLSALVTLGLLLFSVVAIKAVAEAGTLVYSVGAWKPPIGITMVLDGLSSFMLVVVGLGSFAISIFSISYMTRFTSKWKFYTLFLVVVGGLNGVIVTGDIFNLYVFLEIASLATFALVAFGTEKHELEAAFKYAVMSAVGSLFILLGIAMLYSFTSTLNMADIAGVLSRKPGGMVISMVGVLFLLGFGLKAALVPFHAWLPDAHPSAPAPISAMLSGVVIKSLGVYALCRVFFNVLGVPPVFLSALMFLGALSMMVGVLLAVGQWDLKRLLAYHSISQIGYIVLGIGLGTPLGVLGGLFHLFNHSMFKTLLFLNSGALEYATGTRDLREMGGLSKRMPVTSSTNLIASLSISGIPPLNGFWSKLIIILAAVQAHHYGYAFWAVLASVLTLVSFAKVMKYAYYGDLKETWNQVKEVPACMQSAMLMLAAICVVGGVLVLPCVRELFLGRATDIVLQGINYSQSVLGQ